MAAVCLTAVVGGAAVGVDHLVGGGVMDRILGAHNGPSAGSADVAAGRQDDASNRSAVGGRSPLASTSGPASGTPIPGSAPSATGSATASPASPTPARPPSAAASPRTTSSSFASQVIQLVNRQRAAAGCVALRTDSRLNQAALSHSVDMAVRDYFAHDTPEGVTFVARDRAAGYRQPGGENIAEGQRSPNEVMTAWMNSPGHRANILNCQFRAIGVGVYRGAAGLYWTQDFGYS
jgi:uncharacterized protein YkwD